jgi:nucleotide-binding universal stress UspA family protein
VRAKSVIVQGTLPAAILDVASTEGADLIVMSAHGYGGLQRMIFGSVASRLIRDASIPTIVLKYGALARLKTPAVVPVPESC